MRRITSLAMAIGLIAATSAFAIGPRLERIHVVGYLDRAPTGVAVIDRIEIFRGDRNRTIVVTAVADHLRTYGLSDSVFDATARFGLVGTATDVARLLEGAEGAKIEGRMLRTRDDRHLLLMAIDTVA